MEMNQADLQTRGITALQFEESTLWILYQKNKDTHNCDDIQHQYIRT